MRVYNKGGGFIIKEVGL